ncbi:hypothetical protein [Candidatus Amarolinea aalborgensis]|uniref:hypothetical protein n=1 Tax=Candidatus Amarolinea aalborgensis TaxID=2249329 RepID=UPI003BFA1EAC
MSVDTSSSRRLLWSLRGLTLTLLILHLAAPRLGESAAWGLWPITFFAPAVRGALALLVAALCIPAVTDRLLKVMASRFFTERAPGAAAPTRWFIVLALLSMPLFWALRLVHTRWGDAYILTNAIPLPDPALRLVYTWQAPLTVFWHAKLWALGQRLWQWPDAFPAYAITSVAAGAVYVFVVLQLAWEVGRRRGQRLLVAGLLLSLGAMQLFFGYVENYTLPAVAIMIYLWLAARTLAGKTPLWAAAAALGLANALHPSTLNLAPSLLILTAASARRIGWPRALLQTAVPLLLIGAGVIAFMQAGGHGIQALLTSDRPGGGDARWLVPLWTTSTRWEHYTMFSWGHLVDIVNQQLLSAPVSLAVVLLCLGFWRQTRHLTRPAVGHTSDATVAPDAVVHTPGVTTAPDAVGHTPGVTTAPDAVGHTPGVTTAPDAVGHTPGVTVAPDAVGHTPGVTTAPDAVGHTPGVTTALDAVGHTSSVTVARDAVGHTSGVTVAHDAAGHAPGVTVALDAAGHTPGVTTAPDAAGHTPGVTTAPDAVGHTSDVTTAPDAVGHTSDVTTALDAVGHTPGVTVARDAGDAAPKEGPGPAAATYVRFLAVAAAGSLLFILLWNPDYGGQRDWDLFSLSSLPLTALAGVLLGQVLTEERARLEAALPLIAVSVFHTAAWVFQNTQPWEWPK